MRNPSVTFKQVTVSGLNEKLHLFHLACDCLIALETKGNSDITP